MTIHSPEIITSAIADIGLMLGDLLGCSAHRIDDTNNAEHALQVINDMANELLVLRQESKQFDKSFTPLKDTCSDLAVEIADLKQELEQSKAELKRRGSVVDLIG